jgi:hypothetical protein
VKKTQIRRLSLNRETLRYLNGGKPDPPLGTTDTCYAQACYPTETCGTGFSNTAYGSCATGGPGCCGPYYN